jgi:DNA-binding XRE family transcriptional regulator
MVLEEFGLRQIRLAKEISKQEMANRLGIHVNTYGAWEDDPNSISIGRAFQICEILGVDFESLFLHNNSTK